MSIIFNCPNPACRERIEADESLAGSKVKCPACATDLQVPSSKEIAFDCTNPKCGLEIIVDISEAGRVIKCPACQQVLRIPGDPPKTVHTTRLPSKSGRATAFAEKDSFLIPSFSPVKNLILGWGVGAAMFGMLLLGFHFRSVAMIPPHLDEIGDAIYDHGGLKGDVTENSSGTVLFCLEDDGKDLDVYRMERTTSHRKSLFHFKGVMRSTNFRWLGWSLDQHVLAYVNRQQEKDGDYELFLCNGDDGKALGRFKINPCGAVEAGAWLSPNSIALLNHKSELFVYNVVANANLGAFGEKGLVKLRDAGHGVQALTPDSDHSIAYFREGRLCSLDLQTDQEKILTRLKDGIATDLSYSVPKESYLFALRDLKDRNKSSIYQFGPVSSPNAALTCVAQGNMTIPRWIQGGLGMAYIGSSTNEDHIVIQPDDVSQATNILSGTGGKVSLLGIAKNRVYAVANDELQMWRVWEYDPGQRSLHKIVPKDETPTFHQLAPPVLGVVTNAFGKPVDYYYVLPAGMDPHKKYPVFVDQNSANRFDESVQFVANAGILYVSPNRFGRVKWNDMPKAEDTDAVYEELLKNPNVDPKRIYVSGHSISATRALPAVNAAPEKWRGLILISPAPTAPPFPGSGEYPKVYICMGDSDILNQPGKDGPNKFILEAWRHSIPVHIDVLHAGHSYNSDQLKECYKDIAKYIAADQ